jgi:transposase
MTDKPGSAEVEYFAREDALKKQKIALEQAKALASQVKEDLKRLHHMRCPKCGMELSTVRYAGIEIDRCFCCRGTWLDAGELEKIADHPERAGAVMRSVLNIFKPSGEKP